MNGKSLNIRTMDALRHIFRHYGPIWHWVLLSFIFLAVATLFNLLQPLLMREIIDRALPRQDILLLTWLSLSLLGLILLNNLLLLGRTFVSTRVSQTAYSAMAREFLRHILHLPMHIVGKLKTGDLLSRCSRDLKVVYSAPMEMIITIVINTFALIGTAIVLFSMHRGLAVVAIFMWPLHFLASGNFGSRAAAIHRRASERWGDVNTILEESFSGFTVMKALNCINQLGKAIFALDSEVLRLGLRGNKIGRFYLIASSIMGSMVPGLVFGIGGYYVLKNQLTIGELVAFYAYMRRIHDCITQIAITRLRFSVIRPSFSRVLEFAYYPKEEISGRKITLRKGQPSEIRFEHVYFRYPEGDFALRDISFTMRRGQLVALVGKTGSGKTTIARLLLKLYTPQAGEIYIDDRPLSELHPQVLRRQIGVVSQDNILLNRTMRENLLFGCPPTDERKILSAVQQVGLSEVINRLPNGYDTLVGERGIKFSGGERQRLSIARLILKNAHIIILDEATVFLDSQSEVIIRNALKDFLKERITLVIAHRLSTVVSADQILVLDQGNLVEAGNHEELLAQNGFYARLCRTQFAQSNSGRFFEVVP